jgi:hypothetical protein
VGRLYPLCAEQRRVLARTDGDFIDDRPDILRRGGLLSRWHAYERLGVGAGLSRPLRRVIEPLSEGLVALVSLFMVVWGARLVGTTWHQSIAEFPALSVGVTYLPIPVGGAITLLFVAERLLIGRPPQAGEPAPH